MKIICILFGTLLFFSCKTYPVNPTIEELSLYLDEKSFYVGNYGYYFKKTDDINIMDIYFIERKVPGWNGYTYIDFNDLLNISFDDYLDVSRMIMNKKLNQEYIQKLYAEFENKESRFFFFNGSDSSLFNYIVKYTCYIDQNNNIYIYKNLKGRKHYFDKINYDDGVLLGADKIEYFRIYNVHRASPKSVFLYVLSMI